MAKLTWRSCNRCQGLFYAEGLTSGHCPAGGGHNHVGSSSYSLQTAPVAPEFGQPGWQQCKKCQALFFGGHHGGRCPAPPTILPPTIIGPVSPSAHEPTGSENYVVPTFVSGTKFHWCSRCEGLFAVGNSTTGWCPATGGHDGTGSGEYVLRGV